MRKVEILGQFRTVGDLESLLLKSEELETFDSLYEISKYEDKLRIVPVPTLFTNEEILNGGKKQ